MSLEFLRMRFRYLTLISTIFGAVFTIDFIALLSLNWELKCSHSLLFNLYSIRLLLMKMRRMQIFFFKFNKLP